MYTYASHKFDVLQVLDIDAPKVITEKKKKKKLNNGKSRNTNISVAGEAAPFFICVIPKLRTYCSKFNIEVK